MNCPNCGKRYLLDRSGKCKQCDFDFDAYYANQTHLYAEANQINDIVKQPVGNFQTRFIKSPSAILGSINFFVQIFAPIFAPYLMGSFDNAAAAGGAFIGICFYFYLFGLLISRIVYGLHSREVKRAKGKSLPPPISVGFWLSFLSLLALPISLIIRIRS